MAEASIKLPPPSLQGKTSVEEAISRRRSVRSFKSAPLSLLQLSQILWSAQGITGTGKYRAVPSAGATYPLEVFIIAGEQTIESLEAGVYHYEAGVHSVKLHAKGDLRHRLAGAALNQSFIATAPLDIVVCAIFSRTTSMYGKRGEGYVYIEVGHASQNISLQAISLGLATTVVGAFDDGEVRRILELEEHVKPLYIIPAGKPV